LTRESLTRGRGNHDHAPSLRTREKELSSRSFDYGKVNKGRKRSGKHLGGGSEKCERDEQRGGSPIPNSKSTLRTNESFRTKKRHKAAPRFLPKRTVKDLGGDCFKGLGHFPKKTKRGVSKKNREKKKGGFSSKGSFPGGFA